MICSAAENHRESRSSFESVVVEDEVGDAVVVGQIELGKVRLEAFIGRDPDDLRIIQMQARLAVVAAKHFELGR